jgi:hypothetical protein
MSKPIITGIKVVWGMPVETKPVRCDVPGEQRLIFSNRDVAKLEVQTETGPKLFVLVDRGDHWYADPKLTPAPAEHRTSNAELPTSNGK